MENFQEKADKATTNEKDKNRGHADKHNMASFVYRRKGTDSARTQSQVSRNKHKVLKKSQEIFPVDKIGNADPSDRAV
jgi:hypothetical protein